eukprot:1806425-Ditylum_brightwellii.AAC.1
MSLDLEEDGSENLPFTMLTVISRQDDDSIPTTRTANIQQEKKKIPRDYINNNAKKERPVEDLFPNECNALGSAEDKTLWIGQKIEQRKKYKELLRDYASEKVYKCMYEYARDIVGIKLENGSSHRFIRYVKL